MKPAWSRVKLRCVWGDLPEVSDELTFATGRRYQVIGVRGRTIHAIVLPPGEPVTGRVVVPWQWAPRRRRVRSFA